MVTLTKGKVALVDDEDFERVNKYKWYFNGHYAAKHDHEEYAKTGKRTTMYMHHFILGGKSQVDHADRDRLNNCKSNLRICNSSQNMANRDISYASKHGRGVYANHGKYQVKIRINKKQTHLGVFENLEEAKKAYDIAALKHYGEFAYTNFSKDNYIRKE